MVDRKAGRNGEPPVSAAIRLSPPYGGQGRGAVIINGPRLANSAAANTPPYREEATTGATRLRVTGEGMMGTSVIPPATDDWPFVYLPRPSFPGL